VAEVSQSNPPVPDASEICLQARKAPEEVHLVLTLWFCQKTSSLLAGKICIDPGEVCLLIEEGEAALIVSLHPTSGTERSVSLRKSCSIQSKSSAC